MNEEPAQNFSTTLPELDGPSMLLSLEAMSALKETAIALIPTIKINLINPTNEFKKEQKKNAKRLLQISEEIHDPYLEAAACIGLGRVRCDNAFARFERSFQIAKRHGFLCLEAESLIGLGNETRQNPLKQLERYSAALTIASCIHNPALQTEAHLGIANILTSEKKEEQMIHLKHALQLSTIFHFPYFANRALLALGDIYMLIVKEQLELLKSKRNTITSLAPHKQEFEKYAELSLHAYANAKSVLPSDEETVLKERTAMMEIQSFAALFQNTSTR